MARSLLSLGLLVGLGSTLVAAAPSALADEAELVVNGDFSAGTDGWRTNGDTQDLDVVREGGTFVAELTTSTQQHTVLNDRVNTVSDTGAPGQEYVLTARVRTTTPHVNGALRVREVTPEGATSYETSFRLPDAEWRTVELRLETINANAWLDLNVVAWNLRADQNLQIDLVTMTEGHESPPARPSPVPSPAPDPAPAPVRPAPVPTPTAAPEPTPLPTTAPEPAPVPTATPSARPTPGTSPDKCHVKAAGDTVFGASLSSSGGLSAADSLAEVDQLLGTPPVIRHFSPGLPFDWDSPRAELLKDRTLVLSFKANPRDVTSGRHDAFFRDWFRNAPSDQVIYWSYFHEPENNINRGEFTASQYRAAWTHLAEIADEFCKPTLYSTLILTEWTMNPSSKRDYRTYDAGHEVVDVLAFDPYNGASDPGRDYYRAPADLLGNIITTMKADGRPWGIAEIGSRLVPGDSGRGRAEWLTGVGELLIQHDALFATYFHSTSDGNWRLDDRHSAAAWRNLVD